MNAYLFALAREYGFHFDDAAHDGGDPSRVVYFLISISSFASFRCLQVGALRYRIPEAFPRAVFIF